MSMIYEISHRTTYTYDEAVSISHHLARLAPKELPSQRCLSHEVTIEPAPTERSSHTDYFGNASLFFAIRGAHKSLTVSAHSRVEVQQNPPPNAACTPAWDLLRDACRADLLNDDALAGEFSYPSPMIQPAAMFAQYAASCFTPGRPVLEAALLLNTKIFTDFKFDSTATDVATPLEEAFKKKRGVCQDFAHVFIACIRALGLPARYVSGYLETLPPPGKAKLIGADASHAWASVWCGAGHGWVDFDPTNNCIPGARHITFAHGRDFFDVSPLRGIVIGQGSHTLTVAVDVNPQLTVPAQLQGQVQEQVISYTMTQPVEQTQSQSQTQNTVITNPAGN